MRKLKSPEEIWEQISFRLTELDWKFYENQEIGLEDYRNEKNNLINELVKYAQRDALEFAAEVAKVKDPNDDDNSICEVCGFTKISHGGKYDHFFIGEPLVDKESKT